MDKQQQFEFIRANARPARRLLVKEVLGGFHVTGIVAYHDRQSGGVLMEVTSECVTPTAPTAADLVDVFLAYGQFEAPVEGTARIDEPAFPGFDGIAAQAQVAAPDDAPIPAPELDPTLTALQQAGEEAVQNLADMKMAAPVEVAEPALDAFGLPNVAVAEDDGSRVI